MFKKEFFFVKYRRTYLCVYIYKVFLFGYIKHVIKRIDALIIKEICCIPITFNNPLKVCFSNKIYI